MLFVTAGVKKKKHTQEEKGGGVWPTFHLALSTVSQGMHAEWLDSLCNTRTHTQSPLPRPASPPSPLHAPPYALLMIFQNKRCHCLPSFWPRSSAAPDTVRHISGTSPPLRLSLCFLPSPPTEECWERRNVGQPCECRTTSAQIFWESGREAELCQRNGKVERVIQLSHFFFTLWI